MKSTLTQLLSITLLAFATVGATAADVYKWTDDTGRVHYSDKPDGEDLELLKVKSQRTDKAAIAEAKQVRIDTALASAADKRIQDQLNLENEQSEQVRAENCSRASEALVSLRNAQRLYVPKEDGERRYLNEEEIADRIQRAERDKASWCAQS